MTTLQLQYEVDELLADHSFAEPLVVDGQRCHGGFDEDGAYRSPRTRLRVPAIEAWEAERAATFGTPLLDVPLETWPEPFPNVTQTKFLLRHGVTGPTVAQLTRIGTVEGFGSLLRTLPLPDFRRCLAEDVTGTAIDHLGRGLFEAHARDEAGFGEQAGHDRMWFAARDVAFGHPPVEDLRARMLARMGIDPKPKSEAHLVEARRAALAARVLPSDVDFDLETVVARMIGLLLIELSAFHTFAWAQAVLSDSDLVAGDGEPPRVVGYIRADETPHVSYLRTALSELRDRTWVGSSGATYAGTEMVSLLWDRALSDSLVLRRQENLRFAMAEIELAVAGRADGDDLVEELLSLGEVARLPDGSLVDATGDHLLG